MFKNKFIVGEKLPFLKGHSKLIQKIKFWNASFRCDSEYLEGTDAHGRKILQKFPCEDDNEFNYRLANTKPRGHVGPILKKQNSFIFKAPIERTEEDIDYQDFIKSVDLAGSTIDEFMSASLQNSQIDGFSCIVVDHTNVSGDIKTLAQARADGDRYFLRNVKRDSVVNLSMNDGYLTEIAILYQGESDEIFCRYYNRKFIFDVIVDEKFVIKSIGQEIPHGYIDIPVILNMPNLDSESQAGPLSELQQGLTHCISLLAIEMPSSIYTLHTYSGQTPELDENGKIRNIQLGSNRLVYVGAEGGTISRIAAEDSAATTIQTQIEKTEEAIYRTAGIAASSPFKSGPAQSGLSKIYDLHDLSAILCILAKSCQKAENSSMSVLFGTMKNLEPADAQYDFSFDVPDFMVEIGELKEILSVSELPEVIKENHIRGFINRNYDLSEEEMSQLVITLSKDVIIEEVIPNIN